MKNTLKALLFIAVALLSGCDPMHNLLFINESGSDAMITVKFDTLNPEWDFFYDEEMTGDSLILQVPKGTTKYLTFGMGTWSDWAVDDLSQSIEWLKIEAAGKEEQYKSSDAVHQLLSDNRKGSWQKTAIEIKIE